MSSQPNLTRLLKAMDRTWAPDEIQAIGPWTVRKGAGGGQRVSSATSDLPVTKADISQAETAMERMGQPPLFMLRSTNDALDHLLNERGYFVHDPVELYCANVDLLTPFSRNPHDAIPCNEPLALMREIWRIDGIGAARLAVMQRSADPKTYLFSRRGQNSGGVGFVSMDNEIAMLHALVVSPQSRRLGVARRMIGRAAFWARENGAQYLSVAVTSENLPAISLYSGLGMQIVGKYHYRVKGTR